MSDGEDRERRLEAARSLLTFWNSHYWDSSRLLAQGWADALRALHPGERIYTFWDYFRNAWARNAGLRIDHLLFSPSIVELRPLPRMTSSGKPDPASS